MKKILLVVGVLFCLVGCSSKKNSVNLEKIKTDLLSSSYFANCDVISRDTISKKYSIDLGSAEILMISSRDYNSATMILIADKSIKDKIDLFVESYNDQWVKMNYFPEEAELVKKALYQTKGNYIVYIVSKDNNAVLKLINL